MSSSPSSSNSYRTFTVDPSNNLSHDTNYKIRVTTGVKDTAGNSLSSQYEISNGFTTAVSSDGNEYLTVTSPDTGKIWLDRNLGASQVCTSSTDSSCYGNLYQWGRNDDGHESSSTTTVTRAQYFNYI